MEKLLEDLYHNPQSVCVTLGTWDVNTSTMQGSHVELLDVNITKDSTNYSKTDTGICRP